MNTLQKNQANIEEGGRCSENRTKAKPNKKRKTTNCFCLQGVEKREKPKTRQNMREKKTNNESKKKDELGRGWLVRKASAVRSW